MPPVIEIKFSRPFYNAGDQVYSYCIRPFFTLILLKVFGNVHVHLTEPTPNYGVEILAFCKVSGTSLSFYVQSANMM